jgi:uncharacterized OsmC-like protein
MSTTTVSKTFEMIDPKGLATLVEKAKADPSAVRTVRCKTVAEGKKFRHQNFIRNLPAHIVDEPPALLGDDTAPNPTEALLAALGSCVSVGIQANAVARGYTVRSIELDLEGDINITSVWGAGDLSPKRLGLTAVRITARVEADGASKSELDDLVAHAARWSPVLNTITNAVPVDVKRG